MSRIGTAVVNATLSSWYRNAAFVQLTGAMMVSLHSGDPGTTGVNEIGGASYVRQSAVFGIPTAGRVALANVPLSFSGMPATNVVGAGVWAGPTFVQGGLLQGGAQPVSLGQTYALAGWETDFD
jgi:hypothetical protein